MIILSILLFYISPFLLFDLNNLTKYLIKNYKLIILFFVLFLSIFLIDQYFLKNLINFSARGGGVFMKFAEKFNFSSSLTLSVVSFISLIIIDFVVKNDRSKNYFLLVILIIISNEYYLSKYFDPLFLFFLV